MSILDTLFGGKRTGKSSETETAGSVQERASTEEKTSSSETAGIATSTGTTTGTERSTGSTTATEESRSTGTSAQTKTGTTSGTGRETGQATKTQDRVTQTEQTTDTDRALQEIIQGLERTTASEDRQTRTQSRNLLTGERLVENLDDASINTVADLLQRFSGEGEALSGLVDMLQERAGEAQLEIGRKNQRILEGAQLQGERGIAQKASLLAQQAGSTQNSLVQATAQELENDLAVQLAALDAELFTRARKQQTDEYDQVLRGYSTQGTSSSQITQALAGGRQLVTDKQEEVGSEEQTLRSLLESVTQTEQKRDVQEQIKQRMQSLTTEQITSLLEEIREQETDQTVEELLTGKTDTTTTGTAQTDTVSAVDTAGTTSTT